jgi:class 3 adenylate cyclase
VTAFFCDLRGFTRYSESHTPEHVAAMLKAYLDRVARIVRDNGGVVHQYAGDEVIAHFGSSQRPLEDPAWSAVLAAWQIQEDVRAYRESLPPDDRLHFGIGINTGPVFISDMVGESQPGYSMIGDSMNQAAFLERNAAAGQIVIGEGTYQLVQDRVQVDKRPDLQPRGRREPVPAYEVVGLVT